MRVAHVTVARELAPQIRRQLDYEVAGAGKLHGVKWDTIAYHGGARDGFVRSIPPGMRSLFLRKAYAWIAVMRIARAYDCVLLRHVTFDPFAPLFAPFIKNRISVHHANEPWELRLIRKGWRGRAASVLEDVSGKGCLNAALGVLGVTAEIAEFQAARTGFRKPFSIYPNGIDPLQVPLLEDRRSGNVFQGAFMCGTFSEWHGLDKLIQAVDVGKSLGGTPKLVIHLIGQLSPRQIDAIQSVKARAEVFQYHGVLSPSEYRQLLAQCHFGVASLALERQQLTEASTLKVREMLALGLPVFSGHNDVALPNARSFVHISNAPSYIELVDFAFNCKHVTRSYVRKKSLPLIEKSEIMKRVVQFLSRLANPALSLSMSN